MITELDRQPVCTSESDDGGAVSVESLLPSELVNASRAVLATYDDDQLSQALIAALVDVVLKDHRRASQRLERRPEAVRARAIAAWGAKHAWRQCALPSIARLADVISEFDRRDQEGASEDVSLEEIEVAPFDVDLIGAEGLSLTVSERGGQ